MKKIVCIIIVLAAINSAASAQFGNFVNKVKNKVSSKANQRIDNKVDKTIDKSLDVAEGKTSIEDVKATAAEKAAPAKEGNEFKSYSKFDFVPGEQIVYADDFAADEMGQLPLNWNTQGKAELVTLDAAKGNWLRLFPTAVYLSSNTKEFTKNFTVEFDLILDMHNNGYSYPYFSFGLLGSGTASTTDNDLLSNYRGVQSTEIFLRLSSGGTTGTYMESYSSGKRYFITEQQQLSALEKYYGRPAHICIQVQESRLRVWINAEKKFDLPKALPVDAIFNNLFFRTHSSSYKEDQLGFYISNLKVATGLPDTRHKLIEEGKFSTTGILFDVNTAAIRPESNGILKELADVLLKYPDTRIKIIGHTDSDGSDAGNLELSKKRAAAVKETLSAEFKIDAARLETDGKGEAEPVDDNKTKEGKARNRRVEFIKL